MARISIHHFLKCQHSATTWGVKGAQGPSPPVVTSANDYCRGCSKVRKHMRAGLFPLGKVISTYLDDFNYEYVMDGKIPLELLASARAIMQTMRQEIQGTNEDYALMVTKYWGQSTIEWLGVDARLCRFQAVRLLCLPRK